MKWDLPLEPIPTWLDPATEVTSENFTSPQPWDGLDKEHATAAFLKACMRALMKLGLTTEQALEVTSNTISEVGWERHYIRESFNLGGVKIWKPFVESYKAHNDGACPKWCRAVGNKSSGDPPTCYYRVYDSLEHFFEEWIKQFIPKPGSVDSKHRYKKTGDAFWGELPASFFPLLIDAGYKGEVTKSNPQSSITAHAQIVARCKAILIQSLLSVLPDGSWGKASQDALNLKTGTTKLPTLDILSQLLPKE
jgi:hypothetical protein